MKAFFSFLVLVVMASGCAEQEIQPNVPTASVEDEQPPRSHCTGLPNCK